MSERTDTERLDWLREHGQAFPYQAIHGTRYCISFPAPFQEIDIRAAIDAAMDADLPTASR